MKILTISSTPWNNANSFGNTFSNLFEGMKEVELYNISCRHGATKNSIVKRAVQLTDKSVLKSAYSLKYDPCWEIDQDCNPTDKNDEISANARKKRRTISFIIRDLIWKLGRWKKSKTLKKFLAEVNPDIIYLPIYAAPYMCDVQKFIIKNTNAIVVGHISDDVYGYPPKCSPLAKLYRQRLRHKLKKLISHCKYLEVFAENMQEEYSKLFNKECYLIGKGVNGNCIDVVDIETPKSHDVHFVYTGNIGDERYKVLVEIGKGFQEKYTEGDVVLDIYSTTPLTKEMEESLTNNPFVVFHGGISKDEVVNVQKNADYLVHVEGFSKQAIFSAKMSFSTKIIDYMTMNKPIFAVGPNEVNSIAVLRKYGLGIVSTSPDDIRKNVDKIINNSIDFERIKANVKKYLEENRNISVIQDEMLSRMKKLLR